MAAFPFRRFLVDFRSRLFVCLYFVIGVVPHLATPHVVGDQPHASVSWESQTTIDNFTRGPVFVVRLAKVVHFLLIVSTKVV
jgi:hypothetical protein